MKIDRVKLNWQSVAELNEVKNYIMQMTYFLNGPMFNPIQDRGGGDKKTPLPVFPL